MAKPILILKRGQKKQEAPSTTDWFPASWLSGPSDAEIFREAIPSQPGVRVGIWDSGHPGISRIVQRETESGRRFDFGAGSYYGQIPNSDGKASLITADGRFMLLDAGHYEAQNAQGILNGSRDSFISQWVQAASAVNPGGPVFVRQFHEYAGPWMRYHWYTGGVNISGSVKCTPTQWRDMFRRPVDIANNLGITNIIWIWCPTIYDDRASIYASDPGDNYYDILGDDGYGYTDNQWMGYEQGWATLAMCFNYPVVFYEPGHPRRTELMMPHERFPHKPYAIMETGRAPHSTETTKKRDWLANMVSDVQTYIPRTVMLTYSDYGLEADSGGRWTLDDPPVSLDGWVSAVNNPYFNSDNL